MSEFRQDTVQYSRALGAKPDAILYAKGSKEYGWNQALDIDKDGYIKKGELVLHLNNQLEDYWNNWTN